MTIYRINKRVPLVGPVPVVEYTDRVVADRRCAEMNAQAEATNELHRYTVDAYDEEPGTSPAPFSMT